MKRRRKEPHRPSSDIFNWIYRRKNQRCGESRLKDSRQTTLLFLSSGLLHLPFFIRRLKDYLHRQVNRALCLKVSVNLSFAWSICSVLFILKNSRCLFDRCLAIPVLSWFNWSLGDWFKVYFVDFNLLLRESTNWKP